MRFCQFLVFIALIVSTFSCRQSVRDLDRDRLTVKENATAQNVYRMTFLNVLGMIAEDSIISDHFEGIPVNTCIDTVRYFSGRPGFPLIMRITFNGTSCFDANSYEGDVYVEMTGPLQSKGTEIFMRLEDFTFNNAMLNGTDSITQDGFKAGIGQYTHRIRGGQLISKNYDFRWEADWLMQWSDGAETSTRADDNYILSGTMSGINSRGRSYDAQILEDYLVGTGCQYVQKGSEQVLIPNLVARTVNYTKCDSEFSFTFNGKSWTDFAELEFEVPN